MSVPYIYCCCLSLVVVFLFSCGPTTEKQTATTNAVDDTINFVVRNLPDSIYPDNPDIGFRSEGYQEVLFQKGQLLATDDSFVWDIQFLNASGDTCTLEHVSLRELIPTIPESARGDRYLEEIACVNQEWNRNQVRFNSSEFSSNMPELNRVDLARNCLNAYLWEVILYTQEDGNTLPFAHGWFSFPERIYADLFEQKNGFKFARFKPALETWKDPPSHYLNLEALRSIQEKIPVEVTDLSDEMYPLDGARMKKRKEIIYPVTVESMRDLQSDASRFATFSPPGYYTREDPRKTKLGRIRTLLNAELREVDSPVSEQPLFEMELLFLHANGKDTTQLIIGGIDSSSLPILPVANANAGWKNSMGIGNHPFYESYDDHIAHPSETSPYYGVLLDGEGKWLDSHTVGIDGPILHFADTSRKELHLWLLSFERHALVGHYRFKILE